MRERRNYSTRASPTWVVLSVGEEGSLRGFRSNWF
jgi:hypothetical protein